MHNFYPKFAGEKRRRRNPRQTSSGVEIRSYGVGGVVRAMLDGAGFGFDGISRSLSSTLPVHDTSHRKGSFDGGAGTRKTRQAH